MPMVSIIVPVYKVEPYIRDCVESILHQTYVDFELILVDDGSPDNSGAICEEYAAKDKRIRVIHQENAGVSAARNTGLDAARGTFIGWVDSDDIVERDMYQHMMTLAQAHHAEIVQCQHDRACELNNAKRSNNVIVMNGEDFARRMFTKQGADYTNQVSLCSKLFRRGLFDGIRFPEGQVYEDEMQTYKVCLKAEKIIEAEDILYHYAKRGNSIITGETPQKMLDKQMALADRLKYLPNKLPDMESECAKSFLSFSARILCQMYRQGDAVSIQKGVEVLLTHRAQLVRYAGKYDRFYLLLLNRKRARSWVLANDFEPLQKSLRKLKR